MKTLLISVVILLLIVTVGAITKFDISINKRSSIIRHSSWDGANLYIDEIDYDGHEYLICTRNHYMSGASMIHKVNCKYCKGGKR